MWSSTFWRRFIFFIADIISVFAGITVALVLPLVAGADAAQSPNRLCEYVTLLLNSVHCSYIKFTLWKLLFVSGGVPPTNVTKGQQIMNFKPMLLAGTIALSATSAMAGPTRTFDVSTGTQPSNVGVITLTQDGASVDVLVDLLPGYGFINTGGPHTPFAFNIAGSQTGLSITSFLQPVNGIYASGIFTLSTGGGFGATPFGTYGVAIESTAGNGSVNGYFGDLEFKLTRTGGLSTTDFVANILNNAPGYYFAADLSNGTNTGSQAWNSEDVGINLTSVPEPETYAMMLAGLGLMGFVARRRKHKAA
jgi:hypothetical protein